MLLTLLTLALSNTDLSLDLIDGDGNDVPFTLNSKSAHLDDATTYCVDLRLFRPNGQPFFTMECAQYTNSSYVAEWRKLTQPNALPISDYDIFKTVYHIAIAALVISVIHFFLHILLFFAQRNSGDEEANGEAYA
jgi:hypothetical protein